MIENGTYEPNRPGTLEPLWIDGKHVTASVYMHAGEQWVTVFLGGEIISEIVLPAGLECGRDMLVWIAETALQASEKDLCICGGLIVPSTDSNPDLSPSESFCEACYLVWPTPGLCGTS